MLDNDAFLPLIVQSMPLTAGFLNTSNVVYSTLIELAQTNGEALGDLLEPLLISFIKTLTYNNHAITKLLLTKECYQILVNYVKSLGESTRNQLIEGQEITEEGIQILAQNLA